MVIANLFLLGSNDICKAKCLRNGLNDGRMIGFSELIFLSPSKTPLIPPHSVIPSSFLMCLNEQEWKITMERFHSNVILHILTAFWAVLSLKDDVGMTEWGWNEGLFLKQGKTLDSKLSPIPQSFRHSLTVSCCLYYHSIHLRAISVIQSHPCKLCKVRFMELI